MGSFCYPIVFMKYGIYLFLEFHQLVFCCVFVCMVFMLCGVCVCVCVSVHTCVTIVYIIVNFFDPFLLNRRKDTFILYMYMNQGWFQTWV